MGKIKIALLLSSLLYQSVASAGMDADSTSFFANPTMIAPMNKTHVNGTKWEVRSASCIMYAGRYGIPANYIEGTVNFIFEANPTNPNYGQPIQITSSNCSLPTSQPITNVQYSSAWLPCPGCSHGGTYTWHDYQRTIVTEGNPYSPNYGRVISDTGWLDVTNNPDGGGP
jgi:hypothetical protein